jgi:hypothetical protein
MRGRTVSLSIERHLVADLMRFAVRVPTCTEAQLMDVAAVAAARAQSAARPRWIAIFIKAHAIVAQEVPELRRVFLQAPWPRFYEYPTSVALIYVKRELNGEPFHISLKIKDPASLSLREIDRRITETATLPLKKIADFRQVYMFGRLPWPLRRFSAWLAYNIGRQRPKHFGTFAVTTPPDGRIGGWLTPWTSRLSYGRLGADGTMAVNVSVDHRVVEGPTGAAVLIRLQQVLSTVILDELRADADRETSSEKMLSKVPG